MRRTKIVCTLGPTTDNVEVMKDLIAHGMDTARVNFSHGTYESHGEMIQKLVQAREELGAPVSLLLDTKGPEIRIKTFENDQIFLERNDRFTLTTNDIIGNKDMVSVTYENLAKDLKIGHRVLLDDGLIELKVVDLTDTDIICNVTNGGYLGSRKGINIPDVYVNLPSFTDKDRQDICFGIENGFDYIAASFVRSANDVINIRRVLEENDGTHLQIIAKIESRDGVNNIDEILEVSDGIMVARGDLGVEIPPEEVPLVQKLLIKKANKAGKPVITATQMLESMVNNPRPTRAEANDVANAILDGSDAVMLSGETAKGEYPVESVDMMSRIALKTEESIDYVANLRHRFEDMNVSITNAMSYAACTTAAELQTPCIAVFSSSGFSARSISKFRPQCPIAVCTTNPIVWRQLNMVWGVKPSLLEKVPDDNEVYNQTVEKATECGLAKAGDTVVIVAGVPVGKTGSTNNIKVEIVGNVLAKGTGVGKDIVTGRAAVIKVPEEAEKYFRSGDILVTTKIPTSLVPFMKKAAGVVVGPVDHSGVAHAEILAEALGIPFIVCNTKVVDSVIGDLLITLDPIKGFVYNGELRE